MPATGIPARLDQETREGAVVYCKIEELSGLWMVVLGA